MQIKLLAILFIGLMGTDAWAIRERETIEIKVGLTHHVTAVYPY